MTRALLFITLFIVSVGCNISGSKDQTMRYHDDGREKPIVTIVPFFDRVQFSGSWDLSEELTMLLRQRVQKKGNLFLTDQEGTASIVSNLNDKRHPFDPDCHWLKEHFQNEQFIVLLELIEHDISTKSIKLPFSEEFKSDYYLDMLVRMRVVDLRKPAPEIILQEFLNYSHKIPKQGLEIDYQKNHFGKSSYLSTPLAVGHNTLCKKIAVRLEDYILLSKSK